jgi:hypothetical protein
MKCIIIRPPDGRRPTMENWAGILCLPVLVLPTLLPLHHDRPQCEGTTLVLERRPSDARRRDARRILVRRPRGGGRALEKNSAEESVCFMTVYAGHSTLDEEGDVVDIVMLYG